MNNPAPYNQFFNPKYSEYERKILDLQERWKSKRRSYDASFSNYKIGSTHKKIFEYEVVNPIRMYQQFHTNNFLHNNY